MRSTLQPVGGAILALGSQAAATLGEGPRAESETVVGIVRTKLQNRDQRIREIIMVSAWLGFFHVQPATSSPLGEPPPQYF